SGEQEALWAFAGVTSDPALATAALLILDVGGGSTELILGEGRICHFQKSFPLGTVRLSEKLKLSDPPSEWQWHDCEGQLKTFMSGDVRPVLEPALKGLAPRPIQLVGTGGTATILARIKLQTTSFDRAQIDSVRLTKSDVRQQREHLWSLPLVDRKKVVGLPPNRADVILPGVAIYAVLMEKFGFAELRVSTRGLRFAAIMDEA